MKIPKEHPRFESLKVRETLVSGYKDGIVVLEGLIAHGRGEAFDYLIGEKTLPQAEEAIKASAALLLLADDPVISVNGNVAVLCPDELVKLSRAINAKLEVNLFYRSAKRERAIAKLLKSRGAMKVYGVSSSKEIRGISSERRKVDEKGIYASDVVLVSLEDGDRTKGLVNAGKKVIAIDLNPLSRTAQWATVTIVDNVIRAIPKLIEGVRELKEKSRDELANIAGSFDNEENLRACLKIIKEGMR